MTISVTETLLPGVFLLQSKVMTDERGHFIKTLNATFFKERGFVSDFHESYYSVSNANILRGMHFQVPPADGAKLVCCLGGKAQDALLDLRKSSPTYGRYVLLPLFGAEGTMVYMPGGIAHGFWVEEGPCAILYYQQAEYNPACDRGVAWDKCGINWPCKSPITSDRDRGFPSLAEFQSPFA